MTILRCINDDGVKYDLDLLEDVPFRLDISAIESGNIGQAFGVSSQKLTLPPSTNNNEFFGNLYDVGATPSTSFIKTVPCQVLQNGIEIFTGKLYLESVVTDNRGNDLYNVVVVNETVDLGFLIKDKTFSDLDFSFLDHDYTYDNITDSWDQTLLDGAVFYPLINYGFDANDPRDTQVKSGGDPRSFTNYNSPLQVDDFKPAIRVRDCLDAIFSSVGYEYTSSLFTSGSYTDDIYLLATEDDKKGASSNNPISQSFIADSGADQDFTDTQAVSILNFGAVLYNNAGNYDGTNTFTAGEDGPYQFGVSVQYDIINYNLPADARSVTFKVYKNGAEFDVNGITQNYTFDLTGAVDGALSFTTPLIPLVDTDTIAIYVVYTESASGTQTFRAEQTSQTRFQLLQGPTTNLGANIDLAPIYRDVSISDFLQGLIEKFNLVIEPVKNERSVLRIESFNDWVDAGGTVDWSNKVDYNQKWNISHPLQNQPKNIKFTDVEDNIALTQYHKRTTGKLYGEFDYTSESDLANGEKVIGSYFAPTPIKGIDGAPQMILPALSEKDDSSQSYKRTKFAPRLLYHNGRQNVGNIVSTNSTGLIASGRFWFEDEGGTIHAETTYGLASHLQATPAVFDTTRDLHFGNTYSPGHYNYHQAQFNGQTKRNAFNDYWSFYINELYDVDSRLVTLNIFLDPTEIPDIQLNDKIHIDGHYYRINKIRGANVTREDSIEVELIKTLPRKLRFPRRRVDVGGDTPIDLVANDSTFGADGFITYDDFETGALYTGSALTPAAQRDGFSTYGDKVVWNTLKPTTARFTSQTNLGLNNVDESAETIDTRGDNNTVLNNVTTARVEGSSNLVKGYSKFVTIKGTDNTIESGVENSAILQSNSSSISENTTLSTIIGGDSTIISGSNKSVAIGQDLTIHGGNSNIAIGNFDTNNRTVKDLINTVTINPNRDLESWENLGGDDFNGRAYIGTQQTIGAVFRDNKPLVVSAGQVVHLTGSEYANDYIYDLGWTGGSGTATIYLPDTNPSNVTGRDSQGYKRELRFICDNTVNANDKIEITAQSTDSIDGALGGNYLVNKAFEGVTLYAPTSGSWFITQKKA
jgi:hypothetical protein